MNILDKIKNAAMNDECFFCNSKLTQSTSKNIFMSFKLCKTCTNCKLDFMPSDYGCEIRFFYKHFIIGNVNGLNYSKYRFWDSITGYDFSDAELENLQTLKDLHNYFNNIIKRQIFK